MAENVSSEMAADRHSRSDPSGVTLNNTVILLTRIFSFTMIAWVLVFLVSNYLNFWLEWPGVPKLMASIGMSGSEPLNNPIVGQDAFKAWFQLALYVLALVFSVFWVKKTPDVSMQENSEMFSDITAYLIRACYWSVLLVGVVDLFISFLRVEDMLVGIFGKQLSQDLGRSQFRGERVHFPLILASFVIAYFSRSVGFTWLALLIVVAEIQIVIARFVFSYEQAFMADLVRFWYGALFLFASPYTLLHDGHVRVDILYASFSMRGKAWCNALGSVWLGIPLCWIILTQGMWGKFSVINGPLLTYEVTQAGFGLYVKYWLAVFLMVFAVTMMVQFSSTLLKSVAILIGDTNFNIKTTEAEPA